jgi:hypothetical protein
MGSVMEYARVDTASDRSLQVAGQGPLARQTRQYDGRRGRALPYTSVPMYFEKCLDPSDPTPPNPIPTTPRPAE